MTEPAARGTFGATVTQWAIYDAYEEERSNQGGSAASGVGGTGTSGIGTPASPALSVNAAKPIDTSKVPPLLYLFIQQL